MKTLVDALVRRRAGSSEGRRPLARLRAVAAALILLAGLFVVTAGPLAGPAAATDTACHTVSTLAGPAAATDTACHTVSTWYQPPGYLKMEQVWYQPPGYLKMEQVCGGYPFHCWTDYYWYTPPGYFKTEYYWYTPPGYFTYSTVCAKTFVVSIANPWVAGAAHSVTVTAKDAGSNVATWYLGTVHLTSTDPKAILPANYTFIAADNGTHVFSVTLKTAGTQSVTATDTVTSTITGAQSGIVVNAASLSKFVVSGLTTPRTAGTTGSIRVTATDAYGNRIHGYLGTVKFTSSDTKAKLPANYKFTAADAGTHVFSGNVILKTAGMQSVTATDMVTASIKGSQAGIVVNAAALSKLVVSGLTTPRTAGTTGSLRVTATDAYGNRIRAYRGTVHFTSSDPQAKLPANYKFTALDAGTHVFAGVILRTAGTQTVTATDTVHTTIKGAQTGIVVK